MTEPIWPIDKYNGALLPFGTEAAAVDYIAKALEPFCHSLRREPQFPNGLRPDIGIRLKALPEIPIAIEVKKFAHGSITPFPAAIAQASTYADHTGYAAFVAPLSGATRTRFEWNSCIVGPALLVAGQFNVGALYFFGGVQLDWRAGFILSGVQIAYLSYSEFGEPDTKLHDQAAHILKAKKRFGSLAKRS